MTNAMAQPQNLSLENIITTAVQIPGVKVSRESFLMETFAAEDDATRQAILTQGAVQAGISREQLTRIAKKLILARTSQSSLASFVTGIPGGLAMAATIPADVLQFFGMDLRLAQELFYLYGKGDLWQEGKIDEDKVHGELILYLGVMFGVSGAISGVRLLSAQVAKTTLKKMPQRLLTKTFWYPIVKQIGKAIGVKVTKSAAARGASKVIPVVGGVISGTFNFATMSVMANRLQRELDHGIFDYTVEEKLADIRTVWQMREAQGTTVNHEDGTSASEAADVANEVDADISVSSEPETSPRPTERSFELIKLYKELLDLEIITQEEFDAKKKELFHFA